MPIVYFDTNVIRYLGIALCNTPLDNRIRSRIALSPLSAVELLAQLGGKRSDAQESFRGIQAMWNWLDSTNARILDFPQQFVRANILRLDDSDDGNFNNISRALQACIRAPTDMSTLRREAAAGALRQWNRIEHKSAQARCSNVLLLRHHKIKAPEELLLQLALKEFVKTDVDHPIDLQAFKQSLAAYLQMKIATFRIALTHHDFSFFSRKRQNDELDAEQLVYLADPQMRYLTSDNGYKKQYGNSQSDRIRIEKPANLMDTSTALAIIEGMLR